MNHSPKDLDPPQWSPGSNGIQQQMDIPPPHIDDDNEGSHDIDNSTVTKTELRGWYFFGMATEVWNLSGMGIFIPLILQGMAADVGVQASNHSIPCNTTVVDYKCAVQIGSIFVDPTAFTLYVVAISVFLQAIVFVGLGALADYGPRRKQFMLGFSWAGSIFMILFIAIPSSSYYWIGAILTIITNILFGASWVFFYAYLPLLTRHHPLIKKGRLERMDHNSFHMLCDQVGNLISTNAFSFGYLGGIIMLIVGVGISLALNQTLFSLQIAVAAAGVWWFFLLFPSYFWMKPRPGPPLPPNENWFLFSFKRAYITFSHAQKLRQTIRFLIAWFFLSDAFNTVATIAVLFATQELGMTTKQLLLIALIIPLLAIVGGYGAVYIQRRLGIKTKTMVLFYTTIYIICMIYGLIGLWTTTIGIHNQWEIWLLASLHGLSVGALQSFCRVMYVSLVPPGQESEFFALYEISDKGSSFIGPLVVAAITNATGTQRQGFWFLLATLSLAWIVIYFVNVDVGVADARAFSEWHQAEDRRARGVVDDKMTYNKDDPTQIGWTEAAAPAANA